MASTIEAVSFDWYGTLATHRNKGRRALFTEYLASHGLESAPWDRAVLYEVFDYYGRAYNPESSDEEKRAVWIEFTKRLFERFDVSGGTHADSEIHAGAIGAIFGPGCFQLYPDVQPVLGLLRRKGLRLAVISNWHSGLDLFCREMNLARLFDAVIASADIGIEKPDSRIFHEAARRLSMRPDQIVHVGDLPSDDFDGAVAAGLKAILIDRLNKHSAHDTRINDLFELQSQLQLLE
jgi:FMN phosphatase YigB (HAD superfamily)